MKKFGIRLSYRQSFPFHKIQINDFQYLKNYGTQVHNISQKSTSNKNTKL